MKGMTRLGDTFQFTNGGTAVASGEGVVSGNRFGVAPVAVAANAVGILDRRGVFRLPKLATDVIAQGVTVYWDITNKRVTITAPTGKRNIGTAEEAAGNGVAFIEVYVDGVTRANEP